MIWLFYQGLNKTGLPSGLANILNSDFENYRNLEQFDKAKAEEVRKQLAGFWTYSEDDAENDVVSKKEWVEIIDNGIVWQMNKWYIRLPSGETSELTQVLHAYISPYSYSPDQSTYYCEAHLISQIFIADEDTCYGKKQDEMWEIEHRDGHLAINKRSYVPYHGELQSFYPDNSLLDLPDRVDIDACPAAVSMSYLGKKVLGESLVPIPVSGREKSVKSLVKAYYKPIVFEEMVRRLDSRALPDTMRVLMTLSDKGEVVKLKNKSRKITTSPFDELAEPDMKGWEFPALDKEAEPKEIELFIPVVVQKK